MTKLKQRTTAAPGSYRAQRELARSEADRVDEQHADDEPMARLYLHVAHAFDAATGILLQARVAEPPPAVEFVARQVRLAEHARRIDALLESDNVRDAYARWPREPGLTFGSKAGDSALHVAIQFVKGMDTAAIYARGEVARGPAGSTTYDDLSVYPDIDGRFDAWRDRAVSEIAQRTIGPDLLRSPGEIHRDAGSLKHKLRAEIAGYQANLGSARRAGDDRERVESKSDGPGKPALTEQQGAVLGVLRERQGTILTSTQIARACAERGVDAAEESIRRWCGPSGPLKDHGVGSCPKGYAVRVNP